VSEAPENLADRFLQGVGLADIDLDAAGQRLSSFGKGTGAEFRLVITTIDGQEALKFLSTLTWPATRHVAFAAGDRITALINNSRNGSDYADYVRHFPRQLNCRFVRVVNSPQRYWRQGKLREILQYGARIFDLYDAAGETIRSIACVNDGGRWIYHTAGQPHPIEATFGPVAARPSQRFPASQLSALSAAFGLPLPTAEQFQRTGRYLLFAQESKQAITTCSIDEADDPAYSYFLRGMGYVHHMATHAASVVADFERCLAINPAYEPRVRDYLIEARRRLA